MVMPSSAVLETGILLGLYKPEKTWKTRADRLVWSPRYRTSTTPGPCQGVGRGRGWWCGVVWWVVVAAGGGGEDRRVGVLKESTAKRRLRKKERMLFFGLPVSLSLPLELYLFIPVIPARFLPSRPYRSKKSARFPA